MRWNASIIQSVKKVAISSFTFTTHQIFFPIASIHSTLFCMLVKPHETWNRFISDGIFHKRFFWMYEVKSSKAGCNYSRSFLPHKLLPVDKKSWREHLAVFAFCNQTNSLLAFDRLNIRGQIRNHLFVFNPQDSSCKGYESHFGDHRTFRKRPFWVAHST